MSREIVNPFSLGNITPFEFTVFYPRWDSRGEGGRSPEAGIILSGQVEVWATASGLWPHPERYWDFDHQPDYFQMPRLCVDGASPLLRWYKCGMSPVGIVFDDKPAHHSRYPGWKIDTRHYSNGPHTLTVASWLHFHTGEGSSTTIKVVFSNPDSELIVPPPPVWNPNVPALWFPKPGDDGAPHPRPWRDWHIRFWRRWSKHDKKVQAGHGEDKAGMRTLQFFARLALVLLLLWVFVFPVDTFLHEGGHAIAALMTTRRAVTLDMGFGARGLDFALGRLRVHLGLLPGFYGFARYDPQGVGRPARAIIALAGPCVSLALALLFGALLRRKGRLQPSTRLLCRLFFMANSIQFLSTALPVHYPPGLGSYEGRMSDGGAVLEDLR